MIKEEALNILIKDADTNKISDGYHTFGELYDHRVALFIALCSLRQEMENNEGIPSLVWRSRFHSDGEMAYGGNWFVLGIGKNKGEQITYHLPITRWKECDFAPELSLAYEWDGHTSADVLERLKNL